MEHKEKERGDTLHVLFCEPGRIRKGLEMKIGLKIIQYKDGTWGAKKLWFFGLWRYLVEIYDGNWCFHYSWSFSPPDGCGFYDKFDSKKACIKALSEYYHSHRRLVEKQNRGCA